MNDQLNPLQPLWMHWVLQTLLTWWSLNQIAESDKSVLGKMFVAVVPTILQTADLLEMLHIVISAAFRECSNTAGRKTGNPESGRPPALWGGNDLLTAGAGGECADWLRCCQITWILNLNQFICPLLLFCPPLSTPSAALWMQHIILRKKLWAAASRLMNVSFKTETAEDAGLFFFRFQFSSLLLNRKRWTKDLQVKVSCVNYWDSLPPFLTSSSELTAAAVKRAVWMINKDH